MHFFVIHVKPIWHSEETCFRMHWTWEEQCSFLNWWRLQAFDVLQNNMFRKLLCNREFVLNCNRTVFKRMCNLGWTMSELECLWVFALCKQGFCGVLISSEMEAENEQQRRWFVFAFQNCSVPGEWWLRSVVARSKADHFADNSIAKHSCALDHGVSLYKPFAR